MIPVSTKLRMTLATVCTAGALGLVPSAAHADRYAVDHCKTWDSLLGGTADAGGVAFGQFTGATTDTCGAGGLGGGLHAQVGGATMAPATQLDMVLSIPADRPNLHIERVQTQYQSPGATTVTPNGATPFLRLFNDSTGQTLVTTIPQGDLQSVDTLLAPGTRGLRWSLFCANNAAGNGCTFPRTDEFLLHVFKSRLFLNESAAPTLTITGGSLAGAGAKAGRQSVLFDAADTDSGVASVTVTLGTTVVGTASYPCTTPDWSPCKREHSSQVLQVDTTKVPDGSHELVVTARDAANNALARSLGAVVVANGPSAGAPNGASASRLAKLTAAFATTRKRSKRVRYGSRPTVRGRLVNEQGQPIGGATVAVLQQLKRAGADPVQVATVPTGADGTFSYKLAGGPSRTMTFAYSAFANDAKPTATSSLRTVVRAVVSVRISPRSVRAGKRITLTGRLRLLGREGIEVKIQPRDGRVWHTFATVKTTRGGRFRWTYRFKASAAGRTFAFRARVDSPLYPFAAANSKPILVRVR